MAAYSEREIAVYKAKMAMEAARYGDMLEAMKDVVKMEVELTANEKNLISVAYNNVIGSRRASWRILSLIEKKEKSGVCPLSAELAKEEKKKVEAEITKICGDIISIIDDHLIPAGNSGESKVFYYKMKGDYYRYLAEFKTGDDRKRLANQSLQAYKTATGIAEAMLPCTDSVRLGVVLNHSVLHYQIFNSPQMARHLAKKALDEANDGLGSLDKETCKDSFKIMELLRGNLTLWAFDVKGAEEKATNKDGDDGVEMRYSKKRKMKASQSS